MRQHNSRQASAVLWRLAAGAACALMLLLYMQSTHKLIRVLHSNTATPKVGVDSQHHNASRQLQPQAQGADWPAACPACPMCAIELNHKDVAMASSKMFKYETPFIDTYGVRSQAFERLPKQVMQPLGKVAVQFWKEVRPKMRVFPRLSNTMYNDCDSAVLYGFLRLTKPARVFEVGSGFSTRVAHKALRHNSQFEDSQSRHLCIEPFRHSLLSGMGIEVIPSRIQEVDLALFDQLEAGDILILDNSHVTRPYGDVIFELLWILPRLKRGVFVHLHDIFLPWEYPAQWMLHELRPYTEQYMLAAFLYGNSDWEVVLQNNAAMKQVLGMDEQSAYKQTACGAGPAGSSLYMRRKLLPQHHLQATR